MKTYSPLSSYSAFLDARETLINEERSVRRDHHAGIRPITDDEKLADKILRKMRADEAQGLWKDHHDPLHRHNELYPGMSFLTSKDVIHKSRVFLILQKMPKGALLHAHFDAITNFGTLLKLALKHGGGRLFVRAPAAITASNLHEVFPDFSPLSDEEIRTFTSDGSLVTSSHASLTDFVGYKPNQWIPLEAAMRTFGPEGLSEALTFPGSMANRVEVKRLVNAGTSKPEELFETWATACAMIDVAEAYDTMKSVDQIWARFQRCFAVIRGLSFFEPVHRELFNDVFESCLNDGITYVELRCMFWFRTMRRANGVDDFSHREYMQIFVEELEKFKRANPSFRGARVIYSTLRSISNEDMDWHLQDCLQLKREFPNEIAGFDMVGQEDMGRPLLDFAEQLVEFQRQVKEEGIYLPFIFHAGETLGDGTSADDNMFDAVLLGTKRIGHGFSLARHPKLLDICREKNIMIEVCPISNELLRLTSSMPMHPLPTVLNNGVPVALSCDDPAIFGSMGLSYDFYQAFVASEVNGLTTLGTMAYDSIQYSEMLESDKTRALEEWRQAWNAFVGNIIAQSGNSATPSK